MYMASSTSTASGGLHLEALPLIDLRFLSQSELQALSLTSLHSSDLRRCDDVVIPKIDRSIFNESAGSRKQTYSRLRLAPRKPDIAANIPRRPRFSTHLNQKAALEPVDEENSLIIGLLKGLFATETHADDLIPVQVEYKETSNEILQNIPIDVVADSGKKRKRGRPKSEKRIAVYQNGGSGEVGGMGIVNQNGVFVDVAALANAEDPFGPELRRRTEGLTTEEELLGFLTGLNGQWGSRRKKRKIVEASDFGDILPKGWKLLLSMKRKEGRVWLFCRRYIRFFFLDNFDRFVFTYRSRLLINCLIQYTSVMEF